jgi:hypothetical protein
MRTGVLILVLIILSGSSCTQTTKLAAVSAAAPAAEVHHPPSLAKIDFATQIRPILAARCQPCHFSGGKVYQRMPFDRPETIKTLGTKLFTRIKDENERQLIREFLAQNQ